MSKLSILVVDDASFIRDLVKRTLRQHLPSAHVEEAINVKKAQGILKKAKFDLILCDWEMPELSGIELLTWLREAESKADKPKTPFVMVTSRGDKKNVVEAVQTGVSDYIGKPFTAEQLMVKVNKALGKKGKAASMAPKDSLFKDSANNLLGASAKPIEKAKPSSANDNSSLLTGNSVSNQIVEKSNPKKQAQTSKVLATTNIRSATAQAEIKIRDINLQQVLIEADANVIKPQILESIVIDIKTGEGSDEIARINTYVHLVQVIGNAQSNQLLVKLNYVDDDEDKMMMLSKYIASVRR